MSQVLEQPVALELPEKTHRCKCWGCSKVLEPHLDFCDEHQLDFTFFVEELDFHFPRLLPDEICQFLFIHQGLMRNSGSTNLVEDSQRLLEIRDGLEFAQYEARWAEHEQFFLAHRYFESEGSRMNTGCSFEELADYLKWNREKRKTFSLLYGKKRLTLEKIKDALDYDANWIEITDGLSRMGIESDPQLVECLNIQLKKTRLGPTRESLFHPGRRCFAMLMQHCFEAIVSKVVNGELAKDKELVNGLRKMGLNEGQITFVLCHERCNAVELQKALGCHRISIMKALRAKPMRIKAQKLSESPNADWIIERDEIIRCFDSAINWVPVSQLAEKEGIPYNTAREYTMGGNFGEWCWNIFGAICIRREAAAQVKATYNKVKEDNLKARGEKTSQNFIQFRNGGKKSAPC